MTQKTLIFASVAALALSACTTDTNDDPNRRTKTGAVIGGLIGGAIGSSSSDDKLVKGVLGAGVGAAIGGAIGASLDKQAQDLRRDIPNQDIKIENTGSELRVTMPQDLLFATDSSAVRSDLRRDLQSLANNLNDYPDTSVIVVGHTDNTGSANYNFDLSQRRAGSVSSVLRNSGVSGRRIRSYGEGEDQPVASNLSVDGRARNRRVEIVIRPNAV